MKFRLELYRIVKAEGRELTVLGMATDTDFINSIPVPNAGSNAMQNYTQLYSYDQLGNMLTVQSQNKWTRSYYYDNDTNRLLRHDTGSDVYSYDAHGNMVSMPHLDTMEWDYRGNLIKTVGGTITTYYRYDSKGNRVRKIAHKTGAITEERIYIGNYELYRKKVSGILNTERETTFVSDDTKRIAIVDTRNLPTPVEVTIRYQYDNHLGSTCLELDNNAQVISYEEYHPFGTTSYRAGRNATETALKRYKYVGKERDEETGLYYYGARYYAAWLCRFVSVDPLQFKYPHYTPYQYAGNKPISYIDLDGLEEATNIINSDRAIQPILLKRIKQLEDYLSAKKKVYGNLHSKKEFKGTITQWAVVQNMYKVLENSRTELELAKAAESNTDLIISDMYTNSPNLVNYLNNSFKSEGGKQISTYIRNVNYLDEGDDFLKGGIGDLVDFIGEEGQKNPVDENFGENSIVVNIERDRADREYFYLSTGQNIITHEFGHMIYMILNATEYDKFIQELKYKYPEEKQFIKHFTGGHSLGDKSGDQARKFGQYKDLQK